MAVGSYRISPTQTNPWGTASLIGGIVGFCPLPFLGGLLAIVFGVLGVRRSNETHSGKGMSTTGIVLGLISLLLWITVALGAHAVRGFLWGDAPQVAKDATAAFVGDLSNGDLTSAASHSTALSTGELQALGQSVKGLGAVKSLDVSDYTPAHGHCDLGGTITFEKGKRSYAATLTWSEGNRWVVQRLAFSP